MVEVINKEINHEIEEGFIEPTHPGQTLKELVADYNLTQTKLAMMMRVPLVAVNEICNAKRAISPEMAVRLGEVFGSFDLDSNFWSGLQRAYDNARARIAMKDELKKIERFEYKEGASL